MAAPEPLSFVCSIAESKNAISFGRDGIRVSFDLPDNQIAAAQKLTTLRGKILNVSITVENDEAKVQNDIKEW